MLVKQLLWLPLILAFFLKKKKQLLTRRTRKPRSGQGQRGWRPSRSGTRWPWPSAPPCRGKHSRCSQRCPWRCWSGRWRWEPKFQSFFWYCECIVGLLGILCKCKRKKTKENKKDEEWGWEKGRRMRMRMKRWIRKGWKGEEVKCEEKETRNRSVLLYRPLQHFLVSNGQN